MKRIAMIAALLLMMVSAPAQQDQVAQIRKLYAEAKEKMASKKKAELPPDETVVTSNYMAAGAGPIKDVIHYFYSGDFDETLGIDIHELYFITRKYNVGAREFYEEFLFNEGSLVFYFSKQEANETRYYWGPNGFLHEVVKGERNMDWVFASRLAHDLKDAFDKLMNREF
jgi:hypothetical protein